MQPIVTHCQSVVDQLPKSTVFVVAFSGGMDSRVLLHALAQVIPPSRLKALHVHHGLSANADQWAAFCQDVCDQLKIALSIECVDASPMKGRSPEAVAREARHQAFARLLAANEVLVTGHHQDDQAETLLLQLFRGAGVKGVAAMPLSIVLTSGNALYRPLLPFNRSALRQYAIDHGLQWVEDESNASEAFARNYLRQTVLPVIQQRWPSVATALSRSASHFAVANTLLDELAELDAEVVMTPEKRLLIAPLIRLSSERQMNLIRYWLQQLGFQLPSRRQLQSFVPQLTSPEDRVPVLCLPEYSLQRYQHELYVYPRLTPHDPNLCLEWDGLTPLTLPFDLGTITPAQISHVPSAPPYQVRLRQGGEKLRSPGNDQRQCLKKCFQQWRTPPWLRDRMPLVFAKGELVAVIQAHI